jgi:hypothetical protein
MFAKLRKQICSLSCFPLHMEVKMLCIQVRLVFVNMASLFLEVSPRTVLRMYTSKNALNLDIL